MKYMTLKGVLAITAMASTASAFAIPVYLNQVGLRAGSGTRYVLFYDGSDGNPVSTATWDWTGGVLSMTGGFLQANQRLASTSAGQLILSDYVTGLVINTNTGTTAATYYECINGPFNSTLAHNCANASAGTNATIETSVAYNVGGMADCEVRTVGGDDVAGTAPPGPGAFRGLRDHFGDDPALGCGSNEGRGALDMVNVMQDSGGMLILANWNSLWSGATPIGSCINVGVVVGESGCGRAHWLVFTDSIPVPPAIWLLGSALGVLGWMRRRVAA